MVLWVINMEKITSTKVKDLPEAVFLNQTVEDSSLKQTHSQTFASEVWSSSFKAINIVLENILKKTNKSAMMTLKCSPERHCGTMVSHRIVIGQMAV